MELTDPNRADFREEEYKIQSPEKRTFWNGTKKLFKEYSEVASIQGLNYMVKEGLSWFERLWWIIIFVLCVGGCTVMVYQLVHKWISSPVLVTLATKETSVHTIPFPAVTICPETKVSRSCVNYTETLRKRKQGIISEEDLLENQMFDHMALLCRPDNHKEGSLELYLRTLAKEANESMAEIEKDSKEFDRLLRLTDYAQFLNSCKSVDLDYSYCAWMGKEINCKEALTPIITDEGLCYSFNMFDVRDIYSDVNTMEYYKEGRRNPDWNPDDGYPEGLLPNAYPRRAYLNGAKNSLIVALFTKKDDVYYSCRDFALQGVRVSIHMPSRVPRPSQIFFSVGLDRLTTVAVTPSLMTTTDTIKEYDPEDRNCFFGAERKLKYFRLYSQANCNMECWTNFTIQTCGCVHFYMPRDNNTEICSLDKRSCLEEAAVEYPISLLNERLQSEAKHGSKVSSSQCNCIPLCSDLTYNAEISTGKWKFYKQTDEDSAKEYYSSAVKVFFKNTFFLPTEKSELYGIIDFISNAGGILGLFLGFSLFSLAEIVYFLSIKIIENRRLYGYWAGERAVQNGV